MHPGRVIMNRILVLAALAATTLLPAAQLPGGGYPPRPPPVCDFVLVPQTDSGGCYSAGNPICLEGTPPCCQHLHLMLTWNKAVHWFKSTGTTKGPKLKKYYQAIDSRCVDTICVAGNVSDDAVHYQTEDTLVACTPD